MITTIDIPDALLKEVDKLVIKRREQRANRQAVYKPTPVERQTALRLAESQGAGPANAYLKSLGPKREKVKASRGSVLVELAELALKTVAAESKDAAPAEQTEKPSVYKEGYKAPPVIALKNPPRKK
mgnify:CR=1 FL=1